MTHADKQALRYWAAPWGSSLAPAVEPPQPLPARLPVHAALEAYSVLTRLPDPFRAEPATVAEFLRRTFSRPRLALDLQEHEALPTRLAKLGVAGGSVYDALIGLTTHAAGAELVTLDRRALGIYERCGASTRLLIGDVPAARAES